MQFLAPVLLVMATVVTFHGILRTILGPRADCTYPESASLGSVIAFLYILRGTMPVWSTFLLLTAVGLITHYFSVALHRRLSAPAPKA